MITQEEANEIRKILKDTPGWDEMRDCFPKFGEIIDALPDTFKVKEINPMLQDILCDALARARRWSYGSVKMKDILQEAE